MNVEELIQKKKIPYRLQGADIVVGCLNPEHDDSNPSMRIDKITGIFHCFACGFKGNVFKHYDQPVSFLDQKRVVLKIVLLLSVDQEYTDGFNINKFKQREQPNRIGLKDSDLGVLVLELGH